MSVNNLRLSAGNPSSFPRPPMINHQLLTPEAGFVEGCVVEAMTDGVPSYFTLLSPLETRTNGSFWFWNTSAGTKQIHWFDSVRPLTGSMAIWLHAPAKATHCFVADDGDILWFDFSYPTESADATMAAIEEAGTWSERPWWAVSE